MNQSTWFLWKRLHGQSEYFHDWAFWISADKQIGWKREGKSESTIRCFLNILADWSFEKTFLVKIPSRDYKIFWYFTNLILSFLCVGLIFIWSRSYTYKERCKTLQNIEPNLQLQNIRILGWILLSVQLNLGIFSIWESTNLKIENLEHCLLCIVLKDWISKKH